jgi:hypothetical protein
MFECSLFDTEDGVHRFILGWPHNGPAPSLVDVQRRGFFVLEQYRNVYRYFLSNDDRHRCFYQAQKVEMVQSPVWVVVDRCDEFTFHASQEDAMRWMSAGGSPAVAPVHRIGRADDPSGAVFATGSGACRLYHRHVQPSGPVYYSAKVVEQVAADDVLPVVGLPELVASFL